MASKFYPEVNVAAFVLIELVVISMWMHFVLQENQLNANLQNRKIHGSESLSCRNGFVFKKSFQECPFNIELTKQIKKCNLILQISI